MTLRGYDAWKTRTLEDEQPTTERDSEECETCGGDGVVFEDSHRNGEHITLESECPDCEGAGRIDDDGPTFADEIHDANIDDGPGYKDPRI